MTTENKLIKTIDANEAAFLQQDKTLGTIFGPNGVTMRYRAGLGYPTNYHYYFTSLWSAFSSVQAYVLSALLGLNINATVPAGTELRVGLSPNAGSSWFQYNAGAWNALPGASTAAQLASAPLHTVVNSWPSSAWEQLRLMAHSYIDVGFALMTTNLYSAPTVHDYTWSMSFAGFHKDITHKFERTYYPTRTQFKNITTETLDPPLVFTVLPLANRSS